MKSNTILLVEDNPDDELLALHVFRKSRILNKVFVIRDGVEALDYLFCRNEFANRDPDDLPQLIMLDIKLPKLDGLEVLRQIRANPRTHLLPVVILTSSNEERDLFESYQSRANSFVRKPVDFAQFAKAIERLGLYWMVLNETPPERGL